MVNLFQQMPQQGGPTAALLALLEHADTDLIGEILGKVGYTAYQTGAGRRPEVTFLGGPPESGLISGPDFSVLVTAQAPGQEIPPPSPGVPDDRQRVVVSVTGKAPPGASGLSWGQVERILAQAAERHGAESRTGFLVRQFQDYLRSIGIESFPGFTNADLMQAPEALVTLTRFRRSSEGFFRQLSLSLATEHEGMAELRQSGPTEFLTGYCYRDYGSPRLGHASFLRTAIHLPLQAMQISLWFTGQPDEAARAEQSQLRELLIHDQELLDHLRQLEHDPLLWLWSPAEERQIPLADLTAGTLEAIHWNQFQVCIQRSIPFPQLSDDAIVALTTAMAGELITLLGPAFSPVIH
ncbi:MAG: hypothetical protein ACM3XM_03625 [Mycobacterium leprae]